MSGVPRRYKKRNTLKNHPRLKEIIQGDYAKGLSIKQIMKKNNVSQYTLYRCIPQETQRGGFVQNYIRPANTGFARKTGARPPTAVSTSFSAFEDKINSMLEL